MLSKSISQEMMSSNVVPISPLKTVSPFLEFLPFTLTRTSRRSPVCSLTTVLLIISVPGPELVVPTDVDFCNGGSDDLGFLASEDALYAPVPDSPVAAIAADASGEPPIA